VSTQSVSEKWGKGAFTISVLSLVISIISLIASVVFAAYSLNAANQANSLTEKNLELQNQLSNFTSIIVPNPQQGHLDEEGYYFNGTTTPTISEGWLNGTLAVITPHYGNITVEILNFSVSDYFDMLIPEKANLTTVDYTNEYRYRTHVSYAIIGLNQLTFAVNLEAKFYPNPQKLPSVSGSFSEFPIGVLFLKAKLFEPQTNVTTTQVFSSIIFVTVRIF
jgi:hypothetical protein